MEGLYPTCRRGDDTMDGCCDALYAVERSDDAITVAIGDAKDRIGYLLAMQESHRG